MTELLSSKITIKEEEPTIRTFDALPTAVLAIAGVAEKGPIATPQLVTSYEEYEKYFGSYVSGYQLALAVRSFFLNGGSQAHVSRVVHYGDVALPGTKTSAAATVTLNTDTIADGPAEHTGSETETFDMEPGDTLVGNVDGGGLQTATFSAVGGYVADNDTFPVSDQDGLTLTFQIDGGGTQTVTFSGTTTSLVSVMDQINEQIVGGSAVNNAGTLEIHSDSRGTGSSVSAPGGTATIVWAAPTAGTGNVASIDAVTVAEVKTIVEAAWTNNSGVTVSDVSGAAKVETVLEGSSVYLIIDTSGTANTAVGWTAATYTGTGGAATGTLKIDGKYDGTYANGMLIGIANATSGTASEFNLTVQTSGGVVLETFANVSMDDTLTNFVETVVNHADSGSVYVTATDLDAGLGSPTADRPVNVTGSSMTTGDDGLASLDATDYTGNQGAATGLYAFDLTDDITLLAVPDNTSSTVQKAMITYCEAERDGLVFAILDPAAGLTSTTIRSQKTALGAEGDTEYAALYWPRVLIINPSKSVYGSAVDTVTMAPSGMIAGIMAYNDSEEPEGPFYQPAGVEGGKPFGVVDVEVEAVKLESHRNLVYPDRINPITWLRNYGVFVDGSRTLKGDGNFPSIGERRGVSYIERLLYDGLQWVRHKNNTPALRRSVEKAVYAELHSWMRRGAFATSDPATAFFVDVSDALNPPSVVRAGKLVMRIGLNTNAAAEFIIIKITRDTRALDEELYGQG